MQQIEKRRLSYKDAMELNRPGWFGKRVRVVFAHDDERKTTALEVWHRGRIVAENFKLKG